MSLLGKIGGALGGGVKGFLSGGVTGAVSGLFGGGNRPPAPVPAGTLPGTGQGGTAFHFPGFGFTHLSPGGGGGAVQPSGGGCPKGFHLNKHALPASKSHGAVAARTICVRNRHTNALNGRAASRALRRLKRADKMTRKIHHLFHRSAPRRAAVGRKR